MDRRSEVAVSKNKISTSDRLYLTERGYLFGRAAGRVVPVVGQAGEHLRVPRRAQHHVRDLGRAEAYGVAERLHTPAKGTGN